MTTSAEPYPNGSRPGISETLDRRSMAADIHSGRRHINLALTVIAAIAVPLVFFGTKDKLVTAYTAGIIVVCGTFVLVRYNQAAVREMKRFDDRGQ